MAERQKTVPTAAHPNPLHTYQDEEDAACAVASPKHEPWCKWGGRDHPEVEHCQPSECDEECKTSLLHHSGHI